MDRFEAWIIYTFGSIEKFEEIVEATRKRPCKDLLKRVFL